MSDAAADVVILENGRGPRRVRLRDYVDAEVETTAIAAEYAWIKRLRQLGVEGAPLRRRFTIRGDSLWWFAELYLHKQQAVLGLFRTIGALEALIGRERPAELRFEGRHRLLRGLTSQVAERHGIRYDGARGFGDPRLRLARMRLRARALLLAATASRARAAPPAGTRRSPRIAAFIHRAFWKTGGAAGGAESYIGPVLEALEGRAGVAVDYVGVGPTANFRARRWWHPIAGQGSTDATIPIESLAPLATLRDSFGIWRDRHVNRRALWNSGDIRQHAQIGGYDCWPVIQEELAGIALLQWPWSARAMDEAAAALDVLQPDAALTYAEAGGWGRALMLEARRRRIPTAGLQHGFIYRTWLNYRHEPDEMHADPDNPHDTGFPRPLATLLFDEYARTHLEELGRFPSSSLIVTGSPRLDALVRRAQELSPDEIAKAREAAGAAPAQHLVLFAAKHGQAQHVMGALAEAVAGMPDVQMAIKTHPAETPEVYAPVVEGRPNIRVLPASEPLAPLLRASRAVITVNSTVALDAAVLGVPALVIGLPNNLSPFVDAAIMAGAPTTGAIAPALRRILYDEELRLHIERARNEYLRRFEIASNGRAAVRSADAVLALIRRPTQT